MVVEFSIVPIGKGEELAELVAKVLDIVDACGLPYQLTSMGTIVEGEWDDVFAVVKACHAKMREHAARVYTHITIDDREKAQGRIQGKIDAIEKTLGRRVKR